ncbi:hypothetical protein BJY01DRAFT_255983 [Aspergillus pseudoustus]|uniref:Uncharacterized protein n=1 Tax=Aspergillus pseudoustus TaxID=1810923 RepID=A0ABR4IFK3_9EURO
MSSVSVRSRPVHANSDTVVPSITRTAPSEDIYRHVQSQLDLTAVSTLTSNADNNDAQSTLVLQESETCSIDSWSEFEMIDDIENDADVDTDSDGDEHDAEDFGFDAVSLSGLDLDSDSDGVMDLNSGSDLGPMSQPERKSEPNASGMAIDNDSHTKSMATSSRPRAEHAGTIPDLFAQWQEEDHHPHEFIRWVVMQVTAYRNPQPCFEGERATTTIATPIRRIDSDNDRRITPKASCRRNASNNFNWSTLCSGSYGTLIGQAGQAQEDGVASTALHEGWSRPFLKISGVGGSSEEDDTTDVEWPSGGWMRVDRDSYGRGFRLGENEEDLGPIAKGVGVGDGKGQEENLAEIAWFNGAMDRLQEKEGDEDEDEDEDEELSETSSMVPSTNNRPETDTTNNQKLTTRYDYVARPAIRGINWLTSRFASAFVDSDSAKEQENDWESGCDNYKFKR